MVIRTDNESGVILPYEIWLHIVEIIGFFPWYRDLWFHPPKCRFRRLKGFRATCRAFRDIVITMKNRYFSLSINQIDLFLDQEESRMRQIRLI